jgi:DNA-binding CsgD family transcriptional regulator
MILLFLFIGFCVYYLGKFLDIHDKIDKIVVLRRSGMSYSEIARELGVSESFVHAVLRVHGLSSSAFRRISDEDLRRAVEMYRAGVSMSEIARVLGVSVVTISGYLRALGIRNRVRSRCPEIPGYELAKLYLLKSDSEIARIYNTTASCVKSLRSRYRLLVTQSSELLSDVERMIAEECYIYINPRTRWRHVIDALAKKGYKVVRIRYIDKKYRHIIPAAEVKGYIVYRQGCEKAVATHIASLIARHANQQTPRTQIIAAVIDLIWRNKFPEEDKGLIGDMILEQLLEPTTLTSSPP